VTTSWRDLGSLLGGRLEQAQRPALPPAEPSTLSRQSVVSGNDWGAEYRIYRGRSLTVWVTGNPVLLQLASDMPPDPVNWHAQPLLLPIGTYSHAGLVGAFRFKSATPGNPATLNFTAYATGA
jgi:hypothetical protein